MAILRTVLSDFAASRRVTDSAPAAVVITPSRITSCAPSARPIRRTSGNAAVTSAACSSVRVTSPGSLTNRVRSPLHFISNAHPLVFGSVPEVARMGRRS